jgi:hypothetical protein
MVPDDELAEWEAMAAKSGRPVHEWMVWCTRLVAAQLRALERVRPERALTDPNRDLRPRPGPFVDVR